MPNNIEAKIFVGITLTSEVKKHLQNSLAWKLAKFHPLDSKENPLGIRQVPFQGKEFWGTFLNEPNSLESIVILYTSLKKELFKFCPDLEDKKILDALFPQTFLN